MIEQKNYLNGTEPLRRDEDHILSVNNGYKCCIKYGDLCFFKTSRVVVVGLPARTSHVLQLPDVSVLCSSKWVLKKNSSKQSRR